MCINRAKGCSGDGTDEPKRKSLYQRMHALLSHRLLLRPVIFHLRAKGADAPNDRRHVDRHPVNVRR